MSKEVDSADKIIKESREVFMKYRKKEYEGFCLYENEGGAVIGVGKAGIVTEDGFAFRNLSGSDKLLPYEDWRLGPKERAKDLVGRLSAEEIAGLMMYSPHQMVPSLPGEPFYSTYDGRDFMESGRNEWDLTDRQKEFLENDHVRHVLVMKLKDSKTAALWNNEMQSFAESQPFGIPVNLSSDPRHGAADTGQEFKSSAKDVSQWPEGLGIAASFSPKRCLEYAKIIAKEYRALGICTSLSPQVDLATEPRWMRFGDTFGTHPDLAADLAKAYCDGMQTTEGKEDGWGEESVLAMAKHWPGGGTCEGGRDAHYPFGKYAVYPGDKFDTHLTPFLKGAFKLDGATRRCAAVMPYYTISYHMDKAEGKNVGNSYSKYIINDLLREKYGYDGVVCTDWGITQDAADKIDSFGSRCYGVENLSEAERHLLAIENGVDQFGGNSEKAPIMEAYRLGCEKYGQAQMRKRMEESAVRLLMGMFQCGLFDNPYLIPEISAAVAGSREHREAGFLMQQDSVVMLKNKGAVLPVEKRKKVYIPKCRRTKRKNFFRGMEEACEFNPIQDSVISEFYERVEDPKDCDFALLFVESPLSDGYSEEDAQNGGNGYVPISLKYRPYTAKTARKESIAGGDFRESFTNRSYFGKTGYAANESDLDLVIDTKKAVGEKPVIVCISMHNPAVLSEMEPYADGILVDFGVSKKALLSIVSGGHEPSALLPIQLPLSMEEVEKHREDVPFDMLPYVDEEGNAYDFGFGLNFKGRIEDERTKAYTKG